jgi:O-antigen/teichoic acid export membrane protein
MPFSLRSHRLSVNSLILLASNGGTAVLAFGFTLILARGLGQAALGQYAAVMAWILPLTMVVDFGLGTLITREVAQDPTLALAYVRVGYRLRLGIGLGVVGTVWLIAPWLSDDPVVIAGLRMAICLAVIDALFAIFTAIFRAWEVMWPILVLNLGLLGLQVMAAGLVVWQGGTILHVIAGVVLADMLQLGATWFLWRHLAQHRGVLPRQERQTRLAWWRSLSQARPFMVAGVLTALHLRGVMVLLEQFTSASALGWFAAANRLTEAFRLIPYAFYGAVFPVLARLHTDLPRLHSLLGRVMMGLGVYGVGVAIFLWLSQGWLITSIFGQAFAPAQEIIVILGLALALHILRGALTLRYYALHQEQTVNRLLALGLMVQMGLGWMLIRQMGMAGAAWAILAGEGVLLGLLVMCRRGEVHPPTPTILT